MKPLHVVRSPPMPLSARASPTQQSLLCVFRLTHDTAVQFHQEVSTLFISPACIAAASSASHLTLAPYFVAPHSDPLLTCLWCATSPGEWPILSTFSTQRPRAPSGCRCTAPEQHSARRGGCQKGRAGTASVVNFIYDRGGTTYLFAPH